MAICGFIVSTMHYHSDSLHCLEHGHESHYTENDNVCPVCVVHTNPVISSSTSLEVPLDIEESEFSFYTYIFRKHATTFKPERAPPSLT